MKLFIDECLSPNLARWLNDTGEHEAVHPRDVGRLGEGDHTVLARCLEEDRTIVTENAGDFLKLIGSTELHPGLIILPSLTHDETLRLLQTAIAFLQQRGEPADVIVNHVLEVDQDGAVALYELPN